LGKVEVSSVALNYSVLFVAPYQFLLEVSFTFNFTYIHPQMPATDIVPDILLHTESISSIVFSFNCKGKQKYECQDNIFDTRNRQHYFNELQ
jgi:hypothetical protein